MKRSILGSLALCAAFAAAPFVTLAQDGGTPSAPGGEVPSGVDGGVNDPLKTPKQAPRPVPPAPLNEAGAVNDLEGKQAPELSLQDLYGQTHSLAMHRGQVVVLHWIDPTACEGDAKHDAGKQAGAQAPTGTQDRQGPAWNDRQGTGTQADRNKIGGEANRTGADANKTGTTAHAGKVDANQADMQKAKEMMQRYKAQGVKFLFVVSFDGTKKDGAATTPGGTGAGADKGLNHEQGNPNTGAQGDKNDKPIAGTTPQGGRQPATGTQGGSQPGYTPGGSSAPGGARQTTPPVGIDDDKLAGNQGQADRAFVLHLDRQQVVDASADLQSKLGPEFPILLDDGGLVAARYHVSDAPYAFIIDRQGKIAFSGTCEGKADAKDKEQAMREFERELNDVVRGLSVPASAPREGAVREGERRNGVEPREAGDAGRADEGLPREAPRDATPRIEEEKPNDE